MSGADSIEVSDHFFQFTFLIGQNTTKRSFMQLLWLSCVWMLCTKCNNRRFNNTETTIHQLLEKVQIHSFWWRKAANVVHVLGIHNWLACPTLCLAELSL